MKHNPIVTGNAAAATIAVIYLICIFLVGIFPNPMYMMGQSWFHGIQLQRMMGGYNYYSAFYLGGLFSASIVAWLVGYLFATFYNFFLGKK